MVDGHQRAQWSAWGERLLRERYGIEGRLTILPGEHDRNFLVREKQGQLRILKAMRPDCWSPLVDLQIRALTWVAERSPDLPVPVVLATGDGDPTTTATDPDGESRIVWSISHLPGALYCDARPKSAALAQALGALLGRLDHTLAEFDHPALDRNLKWDLRRAAWIRPHLTVLADADAEMVTSILDRFETMVRPRLEQLAATAIHNDANDHNVLVDVGDPVAPAVTGLIDFGDMIRAPAICELAVAGAYVVLHGDRPLDALAALARGYDAVRPLTDEEVALLYPLLLTRLAVSVTNAAVTKRQKPDDPYVTVTEAPAWTFLRRYQRTHPDWVRALLNRALGRPIVDGGATTIAQIKRARPTYAPVLALDPDLDLDLVRRLDLSVEGADAPQDPFQLTNEPVSSSEVTIGRYLEPRLVYNAPAFALGPHPTSDRRTVHIGIDVFAPAGTEVRAPTDAVVCAVAYNEAPGDYGGVVVLAHRTPTERRFYSLYGHLAREVTERLHVGRTLRAGETFARLGAEAENGGWPPHLHLQLGLAPLGPDFDWPGVVDPDEIDVAKAVFPNPAALLNLDDERATTPIPTVDDLTRRRQAHFGDNLSTSYTVPVVAVRGWRHYLFDPLGRTYLDAYNNVPHVGHAHPRITAAAARQLRLLNTNTRYLHPARLEYAEALTSLFPPHLDTCYLLNSASEANELALRLVRAHTGSKDVITVDAGYHGHTASAIDISAYKFNGPGGHGPPDWVHVVPVADPYRGPHRGRTRETGLAYARDVEVTVARLADEGRKPGAFICEPFPSVGGQIVPPDGYLAAAYAAVRRGGGLCIADEVQTGLGRLGGYRWAFEQQEASPDIVVLGKPLGNGYPLAAVVTTRAIASSFANGMEFFSTFGGSTLACVVGREVLRIIEDEALPASAEAVGAHLLAGLRALETRHRIIGDVRGLGLFIGVDLVRDRERRTPATEAAKYVVDRLRARRVLIGRDGPDANVLKIRPPLTFGRSNADHLLEALDEVLSEAPLARMVDHP